MDFARNGLQGGWAPIRYLILGVAFICFAAHALPLPAGEAWDREKARQAWEKASRLRQDLADHPEAPEADYLLCARTYRQVYRYDPHYHLCDDAIFEAAALYRDMAARFGKDSHGQEAEKLLRFLLSDYPSSSFRKEARQRLTQVAESRPQPSPPPGAPPGLDTEAPAEVRSIRHWSNPGITRVSIDLTRPATFTETIIRNPERLFFDIAAATLSAGLRNKTIEVGDAFLQRVRAGQYRADVARIVLDLNDRTEYAVARLENPSRIVVEIRPKDSAVASADNGAPGGRAPEAKAPAKEPSPKPASASPAAAATGGSNSPAPAIAPLPKPEAVSISPAVAAKTNHKPAMAEAVLPTVKNLDDIALPKPAAPTSRGDRTLARVLGLKVGRIVIDPGHGGHDTGTVGPNGLNEKDLVLELARHLRKLLEENLGAEVVLTRDQDVFISLEERTAIANRYQADLFLSIHANSSRSKGTSGVETYFLDFARTAAEREVAARENAATIHKYSDLEGLVQKIARADKMAESREFAALVQKSLFGTAREVFPSTRNRGVRSAPFIVLIGAKMPSILAEVAFISNPRDEKFLTKDMNRQHLAKALYQGIEGYMKTLGSEVAQTQSSPSIR